MRPIQRLRSQKDSSDQHLFSHGETVYRVLNEFELDNKQYALMTEQSDLMGNEIFLFQIQDNEALDIRDENEWDRIVEEIEGFL